MSEIVKLQEIIEKERILLDSMIENGTDDENFYKANLRLDQLIERYIELENQEHMSLMRQNRC